MSLRAACALAYEISGVGFAIAKTIGCPAIDFTISGLTTFPFDNPTKTSASFIASSRVVKSLSEANSNLCPVRLSLSERITPLLSHITTFSRRAPSETYNRVQEMAAAPAPFTTILTSSIFFSTSSNAFNKAAAEIIAVPC